MASFQITGTNDGHIRTLSRAIIMASRVSREALLEFTPDKLKLCTNTDLFLVKFVFKKDFFTQYKSNGRHECFINLKALQMPFKSSILVGDRESGWRSQIRLRCTVKDDAHNQIEFKIGADPPAATLTYRLSINDLDPIRTEELTGSSRTIHDQLVELIPHPNKRDRFLLSAFNSFAPDIDQVSIITNQSEVKFIGFNGNLLDSVVNTTSEFTHKRQDFEVFSVKEDVNITVPLRYLKLFLGFVETNRVQIAPRYIFEGKGLPAHFIYESVTFRGHFVSATPLEYVPETLDNNENLAIENGVNESFIIDDNVPDNYDDLQHDNEFNQLENGESGDDDGYNDNESEESQFLDGNLEGLNSPINNTAVSINNSLFGAESIRSEIGERVYTRESVREILVFDQDPYEIENVVIEYSSDSEED